MPVVIAPILIPLFAVIVALFLWAMSQTGQTAIRAVVEGLASKASWIPGIGWLARTSADALIHRIVQPISHFALAMAAPVTGFVYHVAVEIEGFAFSGYYTAARTLEALRILRHAVIPALLRPLERAIGALPHVTRVIIRRADHAEATAQHAIRHAVAVTVPRALPWVDKRAGRAEALAERALRGVKGVRNLLAASVLGGLIIKALTRAGTGNIYCRNLKNVNRRVCGADPHLLDTLLGGLTLIIGTVSLIEFARACQTVEGEIAAGVQSFLRP